MPPSPISPSVSASPLSNPTAHYERGRDRDRERERERERDRTSLPAATLAPPSPPQNDDMELSSPPQQQEDDDDGEGGDDLEGGEETSPVYSPLSTPCHTPRPPLSPPLGPRVVDETAEREKMLLARQKERERERERERRREAGRGGEGARRDVVVDMGKEKERVCASAMAAEAGGAVLNTSAHNVDSIALRSTLRLLLLQREKAKRDIVTLEEMREQAIKEPVEFVEYIQQQKRSGRSSPTSPTSSSTAASSTTTATAAAATSGKQPAKPNLFANRELPKPQEIYRCPPIEWSQYRILGAPLEHIHEKQRRFPSPSRPVGASASAAGVPQSMQTGGIIGTPPMEYADTIGGDASGIQGRMRLFDGFGQRGGVVGSR